MNDIFDKIDKEINDSFEITDTLKKINIISYDDFRDKVEFQFNPISELPLDSNDYMKWYCINVLKVPEEQFPNNVLEYVNEDNNQDYLSFVSLISYYMKQRFGIEVNNDDESFFNNLYNLYYFFIVKPEIVLVDYLLDYHFYKEGYDFKEVYEKNKLFNVPLAGDLSVDPIEVISGVKTQYMQEKAKRNFNQMDYKDRFDYFIKYAKIIFLDESEFKFYNFFEKLNEYSPCDNYDNLDDQINILYNIKYETEDLITDWFINTILNTEFRSSYINQKIIDPFFKQIRDFEVSLHRSFK